MQRQIKHSKSSKQVKHYKNSNNSVENQNSLTMLEDFIFDRTQTRQLVLRQTRGGLAAVKIELCKSFHYKRRKI